MNCSRNCCSIKIESSSMICCSFSSAARISSLCAVRNSNRSFTSLYCSIAPTFTSPSARIFPFHSFTESCSCSCGSPAVYSCAIRSVISYSSHIWAVMRCFSSSSFSFFAKMRSCSFSSLFAVSFHSAAVSSAFAAFSAVSCFSAAVSFSRLCRVSACCSSSAALCCRVSCCSSRRPVFFSYSAACSSAFFCSVRRAFCSSCKRSSFSSMLYTFCPMEESAIFFCVISSISMSFSSLPPVRLS